MYVGDLQRQRLCNISVYWPKYRTREAHGRVLRHLKALFDAWGVPDPSVTDSSTAAPVGCSVELCVA